MWLIRSSQTHPAARFDTGRGFLIEGPQLALIGLVCTEGDLLAEQNKLPLL
jgi:hypothetical protein